MDPEQLAAFVAGELDADERARIEAALARDPALRAEVERLEVAERALGRLEPARPPEGFEQRLREAVAPALDETLGTAADEDRGAWTAGGDELAARRAPGRWVTTALGAAAGLALLGVAGVALLGVPGTDDAADETAMEAFDDAGDGRLESDADGPVLLATDRDLDDPAELLDEPTLERLRAQGLGLTAGGDLARAYTEQLRALAPTVEPDAAPQAESDAPTDDAADAEAPATADGEARSDEESVARCLDVLLEGAGDTPPIPVYVELLRYEDEPAIAYGMLTPGSDAQAYDRIEVWIVDRVACQVRELRQEDG